VISSSDYIELTDTSKAVGVKEDNVLGQNAKLHTFMNPNRIEMDVAGFEKSFAVEGEAFTKKATFFDNYNWRDLRCRSCNRHIGYEKNGKILISTN
jgi:hypothetical protein